MMTLVSFGCNSPFRSTCDRYTILQCSPVGVEIGSKPMPQHSTYTIGKQEDSLAQIQCNDVQHFCTPRGKEPLECYGNSGVKFGNS